jgi:CubicO group peptidase (beta-lactamase class C family)
MARFVDNVVAQPLMEDPGTAYRYSESPTILGHLVEVWSGQPLDVFMEERLFGPLGMTDTGFWVEPTDVGRLTTVYRPMESGGLEPFEIEEVPFTVKPELLEGTVGLVSTVPDYLKFGQLLLNEGELGGVRLLEAETVRTMVANGLSDAIVEDRGNGLGWGLANVNVVLEPAEGRYLGEYTWNGSAGTVFWVDPNQETVIVVMLQRQPSNPEGLRDRVKALVYEAITD